MGMFYGEYVVFISMTIDTEYNQNDDRTYFNARLSIDYNDMMEILEKNFTNAFMVKPVPST